VGSKLAESNQKEQLSESNKILMDLNQPTIVDSSNMIRVPKIVASFQEIKAEKQELNQQRRDLQATERDLRCKAIEEIEKRWTAIEHLKSEILTLQKNCYELPPKMLNDQSLKKSIPNKPLIENIRQKRTILFPLIVALGLIFYALGIATNFFGSPMFSSFFILSYSAAHALSYVVAVAGVALIAAILTLNFRKNH
jgi:hypothetical protein